MFLSVILLVKTSYLPYLVFNQQSCLLESGKQAQTVEKHQLSETEAIALAEDFIVKNGYTNAPAVEKDKITLELYDKLISFEMSMKLRHNSLQPKAYGVIRNRRGSPGWTIIFVRTPGGNFDPKNGRGVSMDTEGNRLFMEPKDFPLNTVDKKLELESKESKEPKENKDVK
jgi:hypothetical protein